MGKLIVAGFVVAATLAVLKADAGRITADPDATRVRAKDSLSLSYLDRAATLPRLADYLDEIFAVRTPVSIVIETCDAGVPPGRWTPGVGEIAICDDLIEPIADPETLEAVVRFVVFHEFAHALVDVAGVLPTGRREDAADQFAAWMLLDSHHGEDVVRAARFLFRDFRVVAEQDAADEHSSDAQRYFNLLCWTAGARPDLLAPAAELPDARLGGCGEEYVQLDKAWGKTVEFNRIVALWALAVRRVFE